MDPGDDQFTPGNLLRDDPVANLMHSAEVEDANDSGSEIKIATCNVRPPVRDAGDCASSVVLELDQRAERQRLVSDDHRVRTDLLATCPSSAEVAAAV